MCLVVVAYNHLPGYRLVLAANRDEFLDRPTAPLGYHYPGERILAGRDLRGGGTWLGLAADGRLAAITNYRDPGRVVASAPSRGEIILDYLRSGCGAADFLQGFSAGAHRYSGFNLLVGDHRELLHYSNVSGQATPLAPGIHGLSNHLLNTPWPKVERAKTGVGQVLAAAGEKLDRQGLLEVLADRDRPHDSQLPDTGVGLEWERLLGPVCIHSPGYGTRSSSLLAITDQGHAEFYERSYRHDQGIHPETERSFTMTLDPPLL